MTGLGDFDIGAIDLSFDEQAVLTLTAADLEGLASTSNDLIIHGGSDDTVNIVGANNTGAATIIDARSYDIYTLGDDDGTLFIEQGINVTI